MRRHRTRCIASVAALIASFAYGKLVHEGFTLAIVGRPNVGKSSLFNRLLEQDRAIVTEIPGTTRDWFRKPRRSSGIPVKFVDTAGIRLGQDVVENAGHRAQLSGDGGRGSDAGGGGSFAAARDGGSKQLIERAQQQGKTSDRRQQMRSAGAGGRNPGALRGFRAHRRGHRGTAAARLSRRSRPAAAWSRKAASSPACATNNCCANRGEALEQARTATAHRHSA